MAEDVKHAMGKMSRVLRVAKDRAQAQFGKAKEMAQRFSKGSPSGQQPSATFPAVGAGEQKVQQLMALGFSAVAARQSLRVCGGDIELASAWLLDERNADEIMAAEFAAAETNRGLAAGNSAQIYGLRSAPELNGRVVQLYKWDEATQRWIVSLPDGSVKSIRAQNLDPVDLPSRPSAQAPQAQAPRQATTSSANVVGEAVPSAPREAETLDREELKGLAREMLASSGGEQASDEVLNALSVEDLLELVTTLQIDSAGPHEGVDVTASAGYPPGYRSESEVPAASQPPSQAHFARSTSPADSPPAVPTQGLDLESERERLELEEARLQSLAEVQSQRAKELTAREEALREAEERLEKRRAEVDAEREEKKEAPVKIPFVIPEAEMSPTTQAAQEVEAERAELQRLRAEVEAAAKEMEQRQQAAKQRAEERELQFLEEESAQMQMASTLKEEEARLEMQRRSLGMLQQALFKGATAPAQNGYTEHSLNDGDGAQGHGEAACAGKAALSDDESEAGDEVWDLDWSAVKAKDGAPETKAAPSEPVTGGTA